MAAHELIDMSRGDGDLDLWAACECGWSAGPFEDELFAAEAYADHKADTLKVEVAHTLTCIEFGCERCLALREAVTGFNRSEYEQQAPPPEQCEAWTGQLPDQHRRCLDVEGHDGEHHWEGE